MQKTLIAASLVLAGVLSSSTGCQNNSRPISSRPVDQSVLPAQAKSLLTSDAQITSVEEQTYSKGTKVYLIQYTINGHQKSVKWNSKEESTPTGVFER